MEISDITISVGDGTLSVPYIGNTSNATSVADASVGEYISIPKSDGGTYLARIVKHDQNGTKVILNGLYTDSEFDINDGATFSPSASIYTGALTEFKNTLDSNYYDSTNRNFNMTMYGDGDNYASTATMFNGNIGIPSIGEMFSANDIELSTSSTRVFVDISNILNPSLATRYWMMNAYTTTNVRVVNNIGYLDNGAVSEIYGVRPTWYVKNVSIVSGSGTVSDPYVLK